MNSVIIVGAGEVGSYLAEQFSALGLKIVVIEQSEVLAKALQEQMDVRVIHGSGSVARTLRDAGVAKCDLFLAVTRDDPTNLVSALLARKLGARKTISRIHAEVMRDEVYFDYLKTFQLDHVFSAERLAAVELAKFIRNPNQPIVEEIARGQIELQQFSIMGDSPAVGKSIKSLKFPSRVRIGSVSRGGKSFVPRAEDTLQAADKVTVFGETKGLQRFLSQLRRLPKSPKACSVVIAGGGEVALALAPKLATYGYRVRVIEDNMNRAKELAYLLPDCIVIKDDPSSLRVLREEHVEGADYFVTVMPDDEDNVMTCMQAAGMGAARCMCVIQREDYAEAIQKKGAGIGIRHAVSPREAVRKDLMRFITTDCYHVLTRLDEETELVHFSIAENSSLAGKMVRDINLPAGIVLVARLHETEVQVPAAGDVLTIGDTIYALVEIRALETLAKLLQKV